MTNIEDGVGINDKVDFLKLACGICISMGHVCKHHTN